LRTGRGEEAYEHLKAALQVVPRLGDGHDYLFIRASLVLACLQRGNPDEAEYWLRQAENDNSPAQDTFYRPDLAGRAEIALARGLTEVGLGLWRGTVERMAGGGPAGGGDPWLDPWALHVQSASVTAHAYAGRLELVAEPVDRLRKGLRSLLSGPPRSFVELPLCGSVLHALGIAGLASGGVEGEADSVAVRMIALAERLRVPREFQPTMSADRARQAVAAAGNTARAAYADAVSEYAGLDQDGLRAAVRGALRDRAAFSG
jgi:hypothetical protein